MSARATLRALAPAALLLAAATAAHGATLEQIVARHVEARGGRPALAALRTVRMTGRATAGLGRVAIVSREIARPGRIRTEFVFQGTTGVYAWDGSAGWRVSPLDSAFEPELLSADDAAPLAEQADVEGPLVDWQAKGHALELVGSRSLPGGEAHELKLTLRSGGERRVFVDAASGQLVRVELTRRVRGRELVLQADFADFREAAGVLFARAIEIGAAGRPARLRITLDRVEANVAIDATRFRLPR